MSDEANGVGSFEMLEAAIYVGTDSIVEAASRAQTRGAFLKENGYELDCLLADLEAYVAESVLIGITKGEL